MAGIVIEPVAMTLPGPDPDKAPMKALATTETYPAPPTTRPSKAKITAMAESMTFVFVSNMDIAQNAVMEYNNEVFSPVSI